MQAKNSKSTPSSTLRSSTLNHHQAETEREAALALLVQGQPSVEAIAIKRHQVLGSPSIEPALKRVKTDVKASDLK